MESANSARFPLCYQLIRPRRGMTPAETPKYLGTPCPFDSLDAEHILTEAPYP